MHDLFWCKPGPADMQVKSHLCVTTVVWNRHANPIEELMHCFEIAKLPCVMCFIAFALHYQTTNWSTTLADFKVCVYFFTVKFWYQSAFASVCHYIKTVTVWVTVNVYFILLPYKLGSVSQEDREAFSNGSHLAEKDWRILWAEYNYACDKIHFFPQGEASRCWGWRFQSSAGNAEYPESWRKARGCWQPEELDQGQPGWPQQQRHPHPCHHHCPTWRNHHHTQWVLHITVTVGKDLKDCRTLKM